MNRHSDTRRLEAVLETLVLLAAVATIPLTIAQLRGFDGPIVTAVDWIIWTVFAAELSIMLLISDDRRSYLRRNWLSPLIVVLSFPLLHRALGATRLVRLARLTRLVRLLAVGGRAYQAVRAIGRPGLVTVAGTAAVLSLLGGGLIAALEPERAPGGFWDGVWWAVVTVTTVGYGDISPATPIGRVIAIVLMLVGIGLVATLAASIAAFFVGQTESEDVATVEERLDRIERLLEEGLPARNDASELQPHAVDPDGRDERSGTGGTTAR